MSRSVQDRLRDIQTAIGKVHQYRPALKGSDSGMALSAVLREIGIVGEAVNALPEHLTSQCPEIPWRQIAATANFLVHAPPARRAIADRLPPDVAAAAVEFITGLPAVCSDIRQ